MIHRSGTLNSHEFGEQERCVLMASVSVKSRKSDQENSTPTETAAIEEAAAPEAAAAQPSTNGAQRPQLTPEALAKLAEIRARLEVRVGQLVLMLMNVPRYRHQTLADLNHLLLEPLLRDRIAIAHARPEGAKDEGPAEGAPPIGVALWASVSEEVDAKIKEQVKAGTFPVRLAPEEWASGEKVWLLDVVAPTRPLASNVLVNFARITGERQVQLHPVVAGSVDPELLSKLKKS